MQLRWEAPKMPRIVRQERLVPRSGWLFSRLYSLVLCSSARQMLGYNGFVEATVFPALFHLRILNLLRSVTFVCNATLLNKCQL